MTSAISLFSSAGIGDLAFKRKNIDVLIANELLDDRCDIFEENFPQTEMIRGSVWDKQNEIIKSTLNKIGNKKLNYALVTPPCQGMSKNGRGKLLSEVKKGNRPKIDDRNLLIIPALNILEEVKPETIIFENVSEMINTVIPYNDTFIDIVSLIKERLSDYYVEEKILNFSDYGIPQNRLRLITIATKKNSHLKYLDSHDSIFPEATHSKDNKLGTERWKTVRDTIENLEPLDGKTKTNSKKESLHFVSKLEDKKYNWVSNTPEGKSAFSNQCIECGFNENPDHTAKRDNLGVNRASDKTPLYCIKCDALLPRPYVEVGNHKRIMKGFTSAYKRMKWDEPASAITTNFPYVSSDNKIHPSQHRALSVLEAILLQDIKLNEYSFIRNGKKPNFITIRESIGESVPPTIIEILLNNLEDI